MDGRDRLTAPKIARIRLPVLPLIFFQPRNSRGSPSAQLFVPDRSLSDSNNKKPHCRGSAQF
jgi:hypothetical protein